MIIFSNDYRSNFLADKVSTGGPARFAKEFSDYAINKKNIWQGISLVASADSNIKIKQIKRKGKFFWLVSMDQKLIKAVCDAKTKVDPGKILQPVIEQIRRIIKKFKPDIIFLNGFSIFNWIILKAAFDENKKIVIQHAGILAKEINIYADFFSPWGRKLLLQMEKDITDSVAVEIFLNEFSKQTYFKLVRKVPSEKAFVIPLPFSGKKNIRPKFKAFNSDKSLKIGAIARWDRIKNHEAILKLAKALRKNGLPWKIYSVTKIPETAVRSDFKKQYRNLVEVIAPMDYNHIIKFLQKMDLLILPSHFDVSPNVVIEAANEGKITLISPNVGWVNEYRRNHCADLIVDFAKPKAVIGRIKKISKAVSFAKINKMFSNLNKKHDKKYIFDAYLQLFKN
ncbi:MAG: glycosyltransferase family 4 protein [Patescibacteria group bacterium]